MGAEPSTGNGKDNMMKKLFFGFVSGLTTKDGRVATWSYAYATINAKNEDEATGAALRDGRERHPYPLYSNHQAGMMEAPAWMIDAIRSPEWTEEG
jgi:hypothetical protein